jgi:hypothetical protein
LAPIWQANCWGQWHFLIEFWLILLWNLHVRAQNINGAMNANLGIPDDDKQIVPKMTIGFNRCAKIKKQFSS